MNPAMKLMLRPKLTELAESNKAQAVFFYLEISGFMACGFSLAKGWIVFSVLYLLFGLLMAFILGEALQIKGERNSIVKDVEELICLW